MSDLERWFTENAMNPMFQLAEFSKRFKVNYTVTGNKVRFTKTPNTCGLGLQVVDRTLLIGVWKPVADQKPLFKPTIVDKDSEDN